MKHIWALTLMLGSLALAGQEKVGDRWVDNSLTFKVVNQSIKKDGKIVFCIVDNERNTCIENLQTGFELKVFDASGNMIWEGIGSGRMRQVMLPKPMPQANYITITAFKPHVTNKRTGNLIHQDKPIELKFVLP